MRATAFLSTLLLAAGAAAGEDDLEARLQEKLSKPFVSRVPWVQDYAAALEQAKQNDRVVFAYFTRSYAP